MRHLGLDTFEALGHELAAADLRNHGRSRKQRLPVRACVGDPTDMDTRPSIFAIGALTVRRDGDDAAAFDSIFGKLKPHHEEGQLRGAALVEGHIRGFPLTEATIAELLSGTGVAPAARAALAKTAQNLDWLLSRPV